MRAFAWTLGVLTFLLPAVAPAAESMVRIEAGPFLMGSDHDDPGEAPAHRLSLPGFWIDRHKVTNRQFAAFLNTRGLTSPEGEDYFDRDDADARIHQVNGRFAPDPGFEEHPAVEVSWFGARDYCAWLLGQCPGASSRRLPLRATRRPGR